MVPKAQANQALQGNEKTRQGFCWVASGNRVELEIGRVGFNLILGVHQSFKGLTESGNNLILDDFIVEEFVL